MSLLQPTRFMLSTSCLQHIPPDDGREVAFVGRSNAGKSTLINVLCVRRKLAFTSKRPGRTKEMVFFECRENRRLVDLPGYGFATVSRRSQSGWKSTLERYFGQRFSLRGVVLVSDIRHPLRASDQALLRFVARRNLPAYAVFSKADKLNNNTLSIQRRGIEKQLATFTDVRYSVVSLLQPADLGDLQRWIGECLCSKRTSN